MSTGERTARQIAPDRPSLDSPPRPSPGEVPLRAGTCTGPSLPAPRPTRSPQLGRAPGALGQGIAESPATQQTAAFPSSPTLLSFPEREVSSVMSIRLWFRLDEVLPLAEHAAACFDHRAPIAPLPEQAGRRPALIWDGRGQIDQLYSNGLPGWYVPFGFPYTAAASTWQHANTGERGTPAGAGRDTAVLLLDVPGQQPPLLERLRAARDSGVFWVALTTADGPVLGSDAVSFAEQRGDLAPPHAQWMPSTVRIDEPWTAAYPALTPIGYTTSNGDTIPRFDRTTVERMVTDFAAAHDNPDRNTDLMPGERPRLSFYEPGVLVIAQETDDGTDTPRLRVTDILTPDADGLYAVGAHQWAWEQAPGPEGTVR
ncbi:hypothetical protein [Cryptosporangium phraense]|uniref:Uncharacterized protein n=1 Tax=Cryptosporangium phraense TaxID=2593070 RepID=A0A545ANF9_9ACTN|nr:hypothetical protein [Cryptosporangium phraense]TQS42826.1 hypothetical protein FL583_22505 [Cryptosporangium phraense]